MVAIQCWWWMIEHYIIKLIHSESTRRHLSLLNGCRHLFCRLSTHKSVHTTPNANEIRNHTPLSFIVSFCRNFLITRRNAQNREHKNSINYLAFGTMVERAEEMSSTLSGMWNKNRSIIALVFSASISVFIFQIIYASRHHCNRYIFAPQTIYTQFYMHNDGIYASGTVSHLSRSMGAFICKQIREYYNLIFPFNNKIFSFLFPREMINKQTTSCRFILDFFCRFTLMSRNGVDEKTMR